jgi:flagellar hook-associated protein FlgK
MRIDSSGNVGIGTDSPSAAGSGYGALDVRGTGGGGLRYGVTDGFNMLTYATGSNVDFVTSAASGIRFFNKAASGQSMQIDSSGNLLVGGTSVGAIESFAAESSGSLTVSRTSGSNRYMISFDNGGSNVGRITTSTTATTYGTSSDYRLKTDAQPMTGASARVQALNPVNFEWLSDGTRVDGFLAHEAQAVVPEAVTGTKDAVDADGNPEYQGIDQSKLVPLLTAALQEALTKIDDLETRLTALEGA